MKPTAVLTGLLFVAGGLFIGCSFSTKEKTVTATHDDDVLPEPSLMKADTAPSSLHASLHASLSSSFRKPDHKQDTSLKLASFELLKPHIDSISEEFSIAPMPSIMKEEDDSDSTKEFDDVIGCNLVEEAEYPGGIVAWRRFLNRNLRFPEDSSSNGLQGTVVVKFIIDEEGNVTNVEAVSGSKVLGEEAVRVIKKSGKWTPGRQLSNGRHIKSYKRQPIMFHL